MSTEPEPHDVVIVGGGPAAATLIMTLDQLGFDGSIVCFSEEDRLPYDRTVVSKGMLGEIPDQPPLLFEEEVSPVTRVNARVSSIDPNSHTLRLADGTTHGFGRLVLATGADPWVPPLRGADHDGVSLLRRAADAKALHSRMSADSRLVIIGGGVIGLEVAAMAISRGVQVSVLEAAEVPMGRVLPPSITAPLLAVHRDAGVVIHVGIRPEAISVDRTGMTITCGTGLRIPADHVLISTGVRPRVELAQAAGLDIDDGVVVDEMLISSHPDVLAIGDLARVQAADGSRTRTESYTAAMAMGQHAARLLVGEPVPYTEVPWSWSDQYDVVIQATGWPDRATTWVERGSPEALADAYAAIGLRDGRVVAAAGISRGRAVGRIIKGAQAAIAARVAVTSEQAANPAVDLRKLARSATQGRAGVSKGM